VAAARPKVVVVGSTNVDLTTFVDTVPVGGETRIGRSFHQTFGGKGANQAVMAARCGVAVVMITGIGTDDNGRAVTENFRANGVDCSPSFVVDDVTGVAHIWVEDSGENRIVVVPGANHRLEPDAVVERFEAIDDVSVVVGQCEIPLGVTEAVFVSARSRGITTVMNPAPFLPLSRRLLDHTDWLVVNELERAQLASVAFDGSLLVTAGAGGAELIGPVGEPIRVDAPQVAAVDTTGAGDCLIGAFVAALAGGIDLGTALRFGVTCAADSVTRPGAQGSFPAPEQANILFRACVGSGR